MDILKCNDCEYQEPKQNGYCYIFKYEPVECSKYINEIEKRRREFNLKPVKIKDLYRIDLHDENIDDETFLKYSKIIENKEYKESFSMENTDSYVSDMYYLWDGTYIYVYWRYGSFTITKIFRDGKILYDQD